jgi:membrane protein required for colicin V production
MNEFSINLADVAVIAVVVLSALFAFVRGFAHELLSLAAWVGAGIATYFGIDYVIPVARDLTEIQPVADIGSGTVIFLAVLVVLTILTRMVVKQVRKSALGALDRSVGLLFGLARGALLVAIVWLVASTLLFQDEEEFPPWITEARTLPIVQYGAQALYDVLPEGLRPEDLPAGLGPLEDEGISFDDLREVLPKATVQEDRSGYKEQERDDLQGLVDQNQ